MQQWESHIFFYWFSNISGVACDPNAPFPLFSFPHMAHTHSFTVTMRMALCFGMPGCHNTNSVDFVRWFKGPPTILTPLCCPRSTFPLIPVTLATLFIDFPGIYLDAQLERSQTSTHNIQMMSAKCSNTADKPYRSSSSRVQPNDSRLYWVAVSNRIRLWTRLVSFCLSFFFAIFASSKKSLNIIWPKIIWKRHFLDRDVWACLSQVGPWN